MDGLEVDYGEVPLPVEGQEVDPEHGEVVLGVGVPDGIENLDGVPGVVIRHPYLAVLVRGVAVVDYPGALLLVLVVGHVHSAGCGALDGVEVRERRLHVIELPLPEGHVQQRVGRLCPAERGRPRHRVGRLGLGHAPARGGGGELRTDQRRRCDAVDLHQVVDEQLELGQCLLVVRPLEAASSATSDAAADDGRWGRGGERADRGDDGRRCEEMLRPHGSFVPCDNSVCVIVIDGSLRALPPRYNGTLRE